MASAFIEHRQTASGRDRFRVRYRLGGRDSSMKFAGSFATRREARARRDWVAGEIAAKRRPDLRFLEPARTETLERVAERWRRSRIDVSAATRTTHGVNVSRILPTLGTRAPAELRKADVAELVTALHEQGLARESIRKTVSTLRQVLDFAEVSPNPADGVRLPERTHEAVEPPSADQLEAVLGAIGKQYQLPLVALDATGMRVSELTTLRWGDVDEHEGRWRVRAANAKTRQARWVPVPVSVFKAVCELVPREDRNLEQPVFGDLTDARLRTAIARACKATGTPLFSPHDVRHRRASLWHLAGTPAVEAAAWLGHSPVEHLRTYAHVVLDRREIDANVLVRDRVVIPR